MRILILRFSSMGDVTLTVPVVRAALEQNENLEIVFVSREFFKPLFYGLKNFTFYSLLPTGQHKGIIGLWKLSRELKSLGPFDSILDLHSVLRSHILSTFFSIPVSRIDKGRKQKHLLTAQKSKIKKQLKTTITRYCDVFRAQNLKIQNVTLEKSIQTNDKARDKAKKFLAKHTKTQAKRIAIAPLSAHKLKELPAESMQSVIQELSQTKIKNRHIEIFILGSEKERSTLDEYCNGLKIHNVAGQFTFEEELAFIAELDTVVTMDSANLHIAAGLGVRTVSIWGPTHPFTGFGPPDTKNHICISIEELECRPCSVFGEKKCYRDDFACMKQIKPKNIVNTITDLLKI